MKIESSDQDIRTMLSSGYYRIPRFQRPYSWDRENVQDFWDDVIRDNPVDYFIGSMVVYKDGQQKYGVVDGQQRLTTITILLCVLRDSLAANDFVDLAQGIHGLVERKNIDNKPEFIVSTETSYPFFQDRIQKWGKPSLELKALNEELSLEAAYKQLQELIEAVLAGIKDDTGLSESRKHEAVKDRLVAIRDAVLNLKLIFIKLQDEDDAYIIFETLNTRGKDLSLTDLVKNHLTKQIKAKNPASDQVKIKWKHLLELVEGSAADLDVDTFIHHFWLSKHDYVPAKKLFKALRKRVGVDDAAAFLSALLGDAALYRAIHEVSYGKWAKEEARIRRALSALVLLHVEQQTPCVLSLMREYKTGGKIKKKHVEEALVAIENFHFLFTAIASRHSSGGISGMYAALGRRLHEARDTAAAVAVIKDLRQKLRSRVPTQDEVKAAFPGVICTDNVTRQKKLVKYILVGLDQTTPYPVAIDYEYMTIEHLASQSLIGKPGFDDSVIGQIGNLLLVSEELNKKLENKTFVEKKKILVDSGFKLPQGMKEAKEWGAAQIAARTLELAEKAYSKVWKV